MALVIGRLALADGTERLAGATACPNRSVVRPSSEMESERPPGDSGKEVALDVSAQVVGSHVADVSLVNIAWRDVSRCDEVSKPLRNIRIILVVVGGHPIPTPAQPRCRTPP